MKPVTINFTGLSGSGKSTLAEMTYSFLINHGEKVELLDGDDIRSALKGVFGYTNEERIKATTVYSFLAKILNRNGISAIMASVTSKESSRLSCRSVIENYIEIYVSCPLSECVKRDVKGLYKAALSGNEKNVVGIDIDYEIPMHSELTVYTDTETKEECFEKIKEYLLKNVIN